MEGGNLVEINATKRQEQILASMSMVLFRQLSKLDCKYRRRAKKELKGVDQGVVIEFGANNNTNVLRRTWPVGMMSR